MISEKVSCSIITVIFYLSLIISGFLINNRESLDLILLHKSDYCFIYDVKRYDNNKTQYRYIDKSFNIYKENISNTNIDVTNGKVNCYYNFSNDSTTLLKPNITITDKNRIIRIFSGFVLVPFLIPLFFLFLIDVKNYDSLIPWILSNSCMCGFGLYNIFIGISTSTSYLKIALFLYLVGYLLNLTFMLSENLNFIKAGIVITFYVILPLFQLYYVTSQDSLCYLGLSMLGCLFLCFVKNK